MSIHKQGNTYKVRYRIGDKQYSKNGFATKTQAKEYEAEQLRKLKSGNWTDAKAGRVTVEAIFLDWLASKSVAQRTLYDYERLYVKMIAPTWAKRRIDDIGPSEIVRWLNKLQSSYAPASTKKAETIFSQILDWAVMDKRIPSNPLRRAKETSPSPLVRSRQIKKSKIYLTVEQIQKLSDAAGYYALLIYVLAYAGLRFGEASALRVRDVNLLRGRLSVVRAYSEVRGTLIVGPPKSGKAREVPIPASLCEMLSKHIQQLGCGPDSLIFTTPTGEPLRLSNWRRRVFNPAVAAAGLPEGLTPKGLRDTYAALAVNVGANAKMVQEAMGHSDIRLTLDTYAGLFDDDLERLASALESKVQKSASIA